MWKNFCGYTEEVKKKKKRLRRMDGLVEDTMDEMIIELGGDESDEEDGEELIVESDKQLVD